MPPLDGRATPAGTLRYRDRALRARHLPPEHFRPAPGALWLTSLGLGTYIGAPDAATDRSVEEAVQRSVISGRINVLDTAINYRHQRAERSVGRALARLVESGDVARDAFFVATKNGYLAPDGESRKPPAQWIEEELVRSGHLDTGDIVDGSHAMSPSFLSDQFERSRTNLGLRTIDLLYLHNAPEAQLERIGRATFLHRLEGAFELYERLRDAGALGAYGLATWDSLRELPAHPAYLSLDEAVHNPRKVGGASHGFRFVQFPFNLAMPEAATVGSQRVNGERLDLFTAAAKLGLGCMTSVPLFQGQLARSGPQRDGLTAAQTALQFARSAPHNLAALVGQKSAEHLDENLDLAGRPPWTGTSYSELLT